MKNLLLIIGFAAFMVACSPAKKEEDKSNDTTEVVEVTMDPKLVKLWETDTVLKTNESVLFDAEGQKLYVSNIEGKPLDKDGKVYTWGFNKDGQLGHGLFY